MKVFPKIRYNLIGNTKTRKYLKYAIGEIALVVIGILIALQINNWNQANKDNNVLKEYLIKIKSHSIEDLYKLDSLTRGRTQIAELCKKAPASILDKTEEENLFLFMSSGFAFAAYTSSAPYRNVISLAAWQFDTMIVLYNKLKDLGENIIDEIDLLTEINL